MDLNFDIKLCRGLGDLAEELALAAACTVPALTRLHLQSFRAMLKADPCDALERMRLQHTCMAVQPTQTSEASAINTASDIDSE